MDLTSQGLWRLPFRVDWSLSRALGNCSRVQCPWRLPCNTLLLTTDRKIQCWCTLAATPSRAAYREPLSRSLLRVFQSWQRRMFGSLHDTSVLDLMVYNLHTGDDGAPEILVV